MIENIKRFVNKHYILMAAIIAVLVIYFLYWLLCCKDRPFTNKVKGGLQPNVIVDIGGIKYSIMGVCCASEPFPHCLF